MGQATSVSSIWTTPESKRSCQVVCLEAAARGRGAVGLERGRVHRGAGQMVRAPARGGRRGPRSAPDPNRAGRARPRRALRAPARRPRPGGRRSVGQSRSPAGRGRREHQVAERVLEPPLYASSGLAERRAPGRCRRARPRAWCSTDQPLAGGDDGARGDGVLLPRLRTRRRGGRSGREQQVNEREKPKQSRLRSARENSSSVGRRRGVPPPRGRARGRRRVVLSAALRTAWSLATRPQQELRPGAALAVAHGTAQQVGLERAEHRRELRERALAAVAAAQELELERARLRDAELRDAGKARRDLAKRRGVGGGGLHERLRELARDRRDVVLRKVLELQVRGSPCGRCGRSRPPRRSA